MAGTRALVCRSLQRLVNTRPVDGQRLCDALAALAR